MMDAIAANYALALLAPLKENMDKLKTYNEWHSSLEGFEGLRHANCCRISYEAGLQSRQAELVDKDQRIHELNETSLDLEGQIYKLQEQLNEKDKRIESLIAQIEMSDFKDSLGHELKSNLAYLDLKALRGEQ